MMIRSRVVRLAITLVLPAAIVAVLVTNRAHAFRPTAVEFNFGMVGITRGQTARLNAVNISGGTIHLSLNFFDPSGRMIKRTDEVVEPGQAVFLDLTIPSAPTNLDEGPARLQIRGSVEVSTRGFGAGDVSGRQVIPTVEVFDNDTGRTNFALGACDGSV